MTKDIYLIKLNFFPLVILFDTNSILLMENLWIELHVINPYLKIIFNELKKKMNYRYRYRYKYKKQVSQR